MKIIIGLFIAACVFTLAMLCVTVARANESVVMMPHVLHCFKAEYFQKDMQERHGETLTGGGDLSGGGRLVIFEGNTSYTIAVIRIDGLVCAIASGSSVKHSQFRKGTAS
jgi:hypothetical protein